MTIKEFAESRNVSVQAIYQQFKRAGIDISSLKDKKTKQLKATPHKAQVKDSTSCTHVV